MKFNFSTVILICFLLIFSTVISAQYNRSDYFIDGATYGHQMNPSFMPESNYFSIPALGKVSLGMQGNIRLSDFIYKYDDPNNQYGLTTFLSSSVDKDLFFSNLNTVNTIEINLNLTPVSVGFYKWEGFNTVEIGIHSNTGINLPFELFNFMKTGAESIDGTTYRINDLQFKTNNYAEIALGHARKMDDKLSIGGKLKLIFGIANIETNINQLDILLSQNQIEINTIGTVQASTSNVDFTTESTEKGEKINDIATNVKGIGGYGLGLDFGASYKVLNDKLILSASVIDLGFITWNQTLKGKAIDDPFIYNGFNDIILNNENPDEPKNLSNQIEGLSSDITNISTLYVQGTSKSRNTALSTIINIGVEYTLPFYDKLSLGLLSSTKFNKPFTNSDGRFYATVSAIEWFDFSMNFGFSKYGATMGWVMNFQPKRFNFFVGSDNLFTRVTPQLIPINSSKANVFMGMSIPFGSKELN